MQYIFRLARATGATFVGKGRGDCLRQHAKYCNPAPTMTMQWNPLSEDPSLWSCSMLPTNQRCCPRTGQMLASYCTALSSSTLLQGSGGSHSRLIALSNCTLLNV